MRKLAIKTIGCKLNQYDSQAMAEPFLANGYDWVRFDGPADVYIINSCTVTNAADYSSRQAVSRALKANQPNTSSKAIIILTGCYAEVQQDDLKGMAGVDLVIGNDDKHYIYERVTEFLEGNGHHDRKCSDNGNNHRWGRAITGMKGYSRAYIKIQNGCNSSCSYCIVPRARGREVSRPPKEIFDEMQRLENAGYREVVLTGVHIGHYRSNGHKFSNLINELLSGEGPRIRFSSMEPNEIDDDFMKAIEGKRRFCRHIHIAVQSGSDRILNLMNRPYNSKRIQEVTSLLCGSIPGITIGADLITGFPGENEDDFQSSLAIAEEGGFGYLHVFSYSDRPGTEASRMPEKIDPRVKASRSRVLRDLSNKLVGRQLASNIGKTGEIIVESRKHRATEMHTGLSDNYLRAVFSGNSMKGGEILKLGFVSCGGEGKNQWLIGEIANE